MPELHLAPISLTFASLVDCLDSAKRSWIAPGVAEPLQFNSLSVIAEELGAFMHKWDHEMTDGLSHFYDPDPYGHDRRGAGIKIKIKSPQINMIAAVTPQRLLELLPESAWGQGLMARVIMIFSDERIVQDDFAPNTQSDLSDLEHDLNIVHNLYGQFFVTEEYVEAVRGWRQLGEPPIPDHPKLLHYNTRRKVHLYKLSMVSSVDRGNSLAITKDDFNRAYNWLCEAESYMSNVFKSGVANIDGQVMEETLHHITVTDRGKGVSEQNIVHFASKRIPLHSCLRIIDVMERGGQIKLIGRDKITGLKYYKATAKD